MKTYDYEQAAADLVPLKAKFDDCTHGEGNECQMLDERLDCCAEICCEFSAAITRWAASVFSGEVVYDPEAESLFRAEAAQIYAQAMKFWQVGRKAEVPCFDLPGQLKLQAALFELGWVLDGWVSPKLSVAPSARVRPALSAEERATVQKQLASLPAYQHPARDKRR